MVVTNVISSLQIPTSGFYRKSARIMRWVAPKSSADSDFEVEDDEEVLEQFMDDDVMDPDFVLDIIDDDLTPSASGKNTHMLQMLKGQACLL